MPNPVCSQLLPQHPAEFVHCEQWLPSDVTLADLDQSTFYTDWTDPSHPRLAVNTGDFGDKRLSVAEYYRWVFDEVSRNPVERLSLAEDLETLTGIRIPFLFTDYDSKTTEDRDLLFKTQDALAGIRQQLIEEGFRPQTRDYNLALADAIVAYAAQAFPMKADPTAPTLDLFHTVKAGEAACTGFSELYYGLGILAGLPVGLESVEYDRFGVSQNHIRVTFFPDRLHPDDKYVLDGAQNYFGPAPQGEITVPIDPQTFNALVSHNRLKEGWLDADQAALELEAGLKLAPNEFRLLVLGVQMYTGTTLTEEAEALKKKASRVYPEASRFLDEISRSDDVK